MNNELIFKSKENAIKIMLVLIEENYVVMLSKEENLFVVNYEWVPGADRNGVYFLNREEFEENYPYFDVFEVDE